MVPPPQQGQRVLDVVRFPEDGLPVDQVDRRVDERVFDDRLQVRAVVDTVRMDVVDGPRQLGGAVGERLLQVAERVVDRPRPSRELRSWPAGCRSAARSCGCGRSCRCSRWGRSRTGRDSGHPACWRRRFRLRQVHCEMRLNWLVPSRGRDSWPFRVIDVDAEDDVLVKDVVRS